MDLRIRVPFLEALVGYMRISEVGARALEF
jgi:hypothetical protein